MDPRATECEQKGNFRGPCRDSNPEPSVLQRTASISCAPLALTETNRRPKDGNELTLVLRRQDVHWRHSVHWRLSVNMLIKVRV